MTGDGGFVAERDSSASGGETEITLGVLEAVHGNSALTQRSAARELGIALGLANAYLRRCVKKGWVKVRQVPPNRYAYYLTPKGFTEKSRLTAEYLSSSFKFFRRARAECDELFRRCAARGWRRVALCGAGDLSEIATLVAREHSVEIVGVARGGLDVEDERAAAHRASPYLMELGPVDAVVVTDLKAPQGTFDDLARLLPGDRILTPPMLRIARPGVDGERAA